MKCKKNATQLLINTNNKSNILKKSCIKSQCKFEAWESNFKSPEPKKENQQLGKKAQSQPMEIDWNKKTKCKKNERLTPDIRS